MRSIFISSTSWLIALSSMAACGGSTPPAQTPADEKGAEPDSPRAADEGAPTEHKKRPAHSEGGDSETTENKAASCSGSEIHDLAAALAQSACEAKGDNPESKPRDMTDALEVKVTLDARRVAPGGKGAVTVTYHNKSKNELPLYFVVDPEPRFEFEVYTTKGTRVDKPAGLEPPLPPEVANAPAPERLFARVTLAVGGTARLSLPWDAVRHKWASKEVAKGTPVGHGYPQVPGGPLPPGKYVLRVITPIVGISEGIDHELSQPRLDVEVGKP
jgi:predicted small lipoprotein YifL